MNADVHLIDLSPHPEHATPCGLFVIYDRPFDCNIIMKKLLAGAILDLWWPIKPYTFEFICPFVTNTSNMCMPIFCIHYPSDKIFPIVRWSDLDLWPISNLLLLSKPGLPELACCSYFCIVWQDVFVKHSQWQQSKEAI